MIITSPDPQPIIYDDYDIAFVNGLTMSLSVSRDLGDTVDFETSPLSVLFHFAEKTSPTDENVTLPSEDITIMMAHVLSISHRRRVVAPQTKEQKDLFKQTLHKLTHTIQ